MITVVGLGFVGLTTALGFAEKGFKVFGFDTDRAKLEAYSKKQLPFHEPGLDRMLSKHLNGDFIITRDLRGAVRNSEVVFLCVGTPALADGAADLSQLLDAFDGVVPALTDEEAYKVIVVKSTVPPGTVAGPLTSHIRSLGFVPGENIGLASNPEFLREGSAWNDFIKPDRIVIGATDGRSREALNNLYESFNAPIHCVSPNTAEFIKYLSNSMLAAMISFSNELSMVAHRIGDIDVAASFRVLHEDRRWFGMPAGMAAYIYPGCGYGGYCLPKDTKALYRRAAASGYEAKLVREVINTNERIKGFTVDLICENLSRDTTVGILGLAFKPDCDDVRESPAADVIRGLMERGFDRIVVYDPMANDAFAQRYGFSLTYATGLKELVDAADKIVILTSWAIFKEEAELLKTKELLDFRYFIH